MGRERRKYTRFTVDITGISGTMMPAKEVEIVDLSIGGISIKTDRRLSIGSAYALEIRDKERVLSLKGMVVSSFLSESRKSPEGGAVPIYAAGMKFIEITGEKTAELAEFIEKYRNEISQPSDISGLNGLG
jgi:hypothetical protein